MRRLCRRPLTGLSELRLKGAVAGAVIPGARGRDAVYVDNMFEKFEEELKIMYPALRDAYWRKRHLVFNPSFGVIQKPGLVGIYRPHWRAPNTALVLA